MGNSFFTNQRSINGTWVGRYNPTEVMDRTTNHRQAGYGMVHIDSAIVSGSTTTRVDFVTNDNDAIYDFRRYRLLYVIAKTENDSATGQLSTWYNWNHLNDFVYSSAYYSLSTVVMSGPFGMGDGTAAYNKTRYWESYGFNSDSGGGTSVPADNAGMFQMWLSSPSSNNISNQIFEGRYSRTASGSTDGHFSNMYGASIYGDKIDCVSMIAGTYSSGDTWTAGSSFELYGYTHNLVA